MPSFFHYKHFVSALKYAFWIAQRTHLSIAVAAEVTLCPSLGAPIFYLPFYFSTRWALLIFIYRRFSHAFYYITISPFTECWEILPPSACPDDASSSVTSFRYREGKDSGYSCGEQCMVDSMPPIRSPRRGPVHVIARCVVDYAALPLKMFYYNSLGES